MGRAAAAVSDLHNLTWCCSDSQATNHNGSGKKPPRRKLLASFQVLAEELRATLGDDGPLPSSTELRSMKRSDLAAVSLLIP